MDIVSRFSCKTTKSFIREAVDGDPFDLLTQVNRNIFTEIPKKYSRIQESNTNEERKIEKLPISDDGRIMVSKLLDQIEAKDNAFKSVVKKRSQNEMFTEPSEEKDSVDYASTARSSEKFNKPGGRGIYRAISASGESLGIKSKRNIKSKSKNNLPLINEGNVYKSKKGAGDIKRQGMPDPYAYIPLNSKRTSLKYKGKFKAIIKNSKKGAAKGIQSCKRMKKM